ncbi:MAG: beta-galactosidase [Phycisphaerales bacterium JB059]
MPSVTYDGRSFMLDGRRLWLVGASIHFQRVARDEWADRIHAAKLAGFNTIETPVFWAPIEPRPGQFDFSGPNDIKKFIEAVGQAGMHCVLRPGPFVGSAWDLGGLPAWLLQIPEVELRTANQPYLEACGRYLTALADQVRPRQVTSTGRGGALLLIQNESQWTCGVDELATKYLGELARYQRESGLNVPKINANNLWQASAVEGEIDGWVGQSDMLRTLRELSVVRPDQPRIIIDFGAKTRAAFGKETQAAPSPAVVQRRLAEIVAGGGQFILNPFASGVTPGFWAGQSENGDAFAPVQDLASPVDAHGAPGESYAMIRRLATFASQFSRVLANLEPDQQPVILDPTHAPGGTTRSAKPSMLAPIVTPARGAQGDVTFVFSNAEDVEDKVDRSSITRVGILLPDGMTLPVDIGRQSVAWCLFNVNLNARATLDYCSLNAFGVVGDVFVCFGPAGGRGTLSIDGAPVEVDIPRGRKPIIEQVEGIHVVVCSGDLIDQTFLTEDAVFVGVAGVTAEGEPIEGEHPGYVRIDKDGTSKNLTFKEDEGKKPKLPKSGKTSLASLECSPASDQISGSSPRYAAISGPADLGVLGSPYGYGWYRISLKGHSGGKVTLAAPGGGDRLTLMLDGERVGVLGSGPGASRTIPVQLKKTSETLVVLADNLGRVSAGVDLKAPKGLPDHLYEVEPFKPGKAKIETGEPIEPLKHFAPLMYMLEGDATSPSRVTWSFQHRRKSPLILHMPELPARCVLVINDEPVRFIEAGAPREIVLDHESTKRGMNTLQLVPMVDAIDPSVAEAQVEAFAKAVQQTEFLEGTNALTQKAAWAFAKWEEPGATTFKKASKETKPTGPTWWRATFDAILSLDTPAEIELTGMTKGVVFLNGENLGRYFVATSEGAKVGPVTSLPLPRALLKEKGNRLVIFDECGGVPSRTKVVYQTDRRPIRAGV